MMVTAILEGPGDVLSVPCLLSRSGALWEDNIVTANPIRSGGFHILSRPGQLERFVRMAIGRPGTDLVLVVVDLYDGCAVEEAQRFNERIAQMNICGGPPVRVCFCVREYESLFLAGLEGLRVAAPEHGWDEAFSCEHPEKVRGAKGAINRAMKRHYKELVDQPSLTGKLDLKELFQRSRTYRKLLRCLTDFNYEELEVLLGAR